MITTLLFSIPITIKPLTQHPEIVGVSPKTQLQAYPLKRIIS